METFEKIYFIIVTLFLVVLFIYSSGLSIGFVKIETERNNLEQELDRLKDYMHGSWCTIEYYYSEQYNRSVDRIICK